MGLPPHLITGLRGEQLAARYLRKAGYQIIDANFSTKLGETDIIARTKNGLLCFIEVKTRSPGHMFPPSDAVDHSKRENLKANAIAYLRANKVNDKEIRFDIMEVILYDLDTADFNHIKDAF